MHGIITLVSTEPEEEIHRGKLNKNTFQLWFKVELEQQVSMLVVRMVAMTRRSAVTCPNRANFRRSIMIMKNDSKRSQLARHGMSPALLTAFCGDR